MVMNNNLKLALRIAGTKERRAGFASLVAVGVLPGGEGDNMYRSTMVAERPVYVIKHAEEYILYQLIDRGVKPFDADANGLLNIALAISRNFQLAEGKSPFTLLNEVYKKFVETYMEPKSDGRLSFLNTDNDDGIFREIVGKYSLEERKSPYIVMNPTGLTGIVCVAPDDMEDFFKDTQYKEFASYKDIEVGINCRAQVSPDFANLQIPLPPPVFNVWVNGNPTEKEMQFPDDSYTAAAESTKFYSYDSVSFTLGELLATSKNKISKNGSVISLDFKKNCINCELKKVDINYNFVYDWTDNIGQAKEQISSLIKARKVKLKLGDEDISKTLFEGGHIKGAEINGRKVTIDPKVVEKYSLSLDFNIDTESHEIVTRIIIKRRATTGPGGTGGSKIIGHGGQSNVNQPGGNVSDSGNAQTKQPEPQNKKKFDVMSFVLGLVAGLLIGLGIWGGVAMLTQGQTCKGTDSDTTAVKAIEENENMPKTTMASDSGTSISPVQKSEISAGDDERARVQAEKEEKAEEAKANAKAKAQALPKLIKTINSKDLQRCKALEVWGLLSNNEQIAIEAVLRPEQYKNNVNGQGKLLLDDIINRPFSFKTLDEVKNVHNEIISIVENYKKS